MNDYPRQIPVGTDPYQIIYERQDDQLLVQFNEDVNDDQIAKFLRSQKQKERSAEPFPRNIDILHAAQMRLVTIGEPVESLRDYANALVQQNAEVEMALPVYYAEGQGPESAAAPLPDTIVVQMKTGLDQQTADYLNELGFSYNSQMSSLLQPFHYFNRAQATKAASAAEQADIFELCDKVAELPGVELVELDWIKLNTYQVVPSDTFFSNQWNLNQIKVAKAWDVEMGDPSVWVAIIDSGFDLAHPDLTFTPLNTHFNAVQALGGMLPPYDASSSGVFHGTAVSGIAAASLNNLTGVAGIAGGCTIMPVRLGTVPSADRVAAGINWAVINGAKVGNLSLTTTPTAAAIGAVNNAWNAGMVLCAATGNWAADASSPPVGFPANHANVIAVGASDQSDQRKRPSSTDGECWGSQYGPEIDVVAPGVLCWTSDEQGLSGYNDNNGGPVNWACVNYPSSGDGTGDYVDVFDGTSAATPHVVGLAALLFSAYPQLNNQQVRDIIELTCDKVSPALYPYANVAGRDNGTWHEEMGYGRINCEAALNYPDFQYAVKFVCGNSCGDVVARGNYHTAINIHNPTDQRIKILKKFAIALPGETVGRVTEFSTAVLGPCEALEIDCADIVAHTRTTPGCFLKGFAIIESEVNITVEAVYTAAGKKKYIKSLYMERVPFRKVFNFPPTWQQAQTN